MGCCALTTATIPPYLTEPELTGHIYGTLSFEPGSNSWIITGEPVVVELAKRLFPGSSSRGPKIARFPVNKRTTGDLNWLMLKYPLRIENRERWDRIRAEAVEYAIQKRQMAEQPTRIKPPPATFLGELYPFQEEGLAWLLTHRRTLLADEQGLGKTVQALAFLAAASPVSLPALVVCQPQVMRQGVRMVQGFVRLETPGHTFQANLLERPLTAVHLLQGLRPYDLPPAAVYIIHYGLLRGWVDFLEQFGFATVIFDEIQELRHDGSKKYSAASAIAGQVPNVFGLSGTPIHNLGGEIWRVANILEYHCLGDWESFTREWCVGYGSEKVEKPELLGSYLRREGLMLRREKANVLTDLPEKRRVVQEIDMDEGLFKSMIGKAVQLAVEFGETEDFLQKGRLKREAVDLTRRITGIAKARDVAAFVRVLLEAGQSVVLAAWHHDVWDIYLDALGHHKPAMVTGRETPSQKDAEVQRFIRGETDLICISLRTAAGLDGLQGRASCIVFGELDWSPSVHSQLEDRLHRHGQKDSVLAYYLVAPEGTDQDMLEALGLKVQQFAGIVGGRPESEQDKVLAQVAVQEHMHRVIERLQTRGRKGA